MSMLAARMTKMKSGNVNGISRHNDRKNEHNSNKEIDKDKSHLNYDLIQRENENITLLKETQDFIEKNKFGNRATRKDSVLMVEWIVTSDSDFFENLSSDKKREFFESAVEYFQTRFGAKNVRYAKVHMDETTEHMHMGIIPFDEENKLSAKRVFNRTTLLEIQENLPKFLQKRGFDIERGEKGSDRKHLDVKSFKKEMDRKLKAQKLMLEERELMINELTNHASDLELKIDAMTIVVDELNDELEEKFERLSSNELTPEDFGYPDIESMAYENYSLRNELKSAYDKLKIYADKLTQLDVWNPIKAVANIGKITNLIQQIIPALENFAEKLQVNKKSFSQFTQENLELLRKKRTINTKGSLDERMVKAQEKLRQEQTKMKDETKRTLDEPNLDEYPFR